MAHLEHKEKMAVLKLQQNFLEQQMIQRRAEHKSLMNVLKLQQESLLGQQQMQRNDDTTNLLMDLSSYSTIFTDSVRVLQTEEDHDIEDLG